MDTPVVAIQPFQDKFRDDVIDVWERSVVATHHFIKPEDLDYFRDIVRTIDFYSFGVHCLIAEDKLIGFVGVAGRKIEMLFLDPDFIGQGFGKKLMRFAMDDLGADQVDVNEQNTNATAFYSRFGFVVYERTDKDAEGKDYPILKMRL